MFSNQSSVSANSQWYSKANNTCALSSTTSASSAELLSTTSVSDPICCNETSDGFFRGYSRTSSPRWCQSDLAAALQLVRGGTPIKPAAERCNIPVMTLWRRTRALGIVSSKVQCGFRYPSARARTRQHSASENVLKSLAKTIGNRPTCPDSSYSSTSSTNRLINGSLCEVPQRDSSPKDIKIKPPGVEDSSLELKNTAIYTLDKHGPASNSINPSQDSCHMPVNSSNGSKQGVSDDMNCDLKNISYYKMENTTDTPQDLTVHSRSCEIRNLTVSRSSDSPDNLKIKIKVEKSEND